MARIPHPRTQTSSRFLVACLAIVLPACSTPSPAGDAGLIRASHTTMGSALDISVVTAESPAVRAALADAFAEVDRLDTLMSVWKPGSDILRLNEAAGRAPVPVSQEVLEVLQRGIQAGNQTDGKFDITFGALSGLWRFDAQNESDQIPDRAEVARRLPLIDYQQLDIDSAARTAFLRRASMSAHLGGIGKGYAVDRVAAILRRAGFNDFLIQFGGDLMAAGLREGRPWSVGIRDPRGPETRIFAAVGLVDEAFSTSGDYERFFISGGRRYHHILDPDTGEPARGSRSVTVLARDSVTADVLSTGVFVLGPDRGMALVERLPDVEAVIVTETNQVLVSSGLRDRLTRLAEPTDAP